MSHFIQNATPSLYKGSILCYNEFMTTKRSRTRKGIFKPVRSDTKVSTIEKKYNIDLGVRPNMKIGNYLKQKGYPSLSGMLRDSE